MITMSIFWALVLLLFATKLISLAKGKNRMHGKDHKTWFLKNFGKKKKKKKKKKGESGFARNGDGTGVFDADAYHVHL